MLIRLRPADFNISRRRLEIRMNGLLHGYLTACNLFYVTHAECVCRQKIIEDEELTIEFYSSFIINESAFIDYLRQHAREPITEIEYNTWLDSHYCIIRPPSDLAAVEKVVKKIIPNGHYELHMRYHCQLIFHEPLTLDDLLYITAKLA